MSARPSIAWPIALVLVAVVLASFAPAALTNDFVNWDDDVVLTDNPAYRGFSPAHLRWMATTTHGGHYQPLTWLSYAVDHAWWGMDPRGYHATNLVLHALATLVLWRLLVALLGARDDAPTTAVAAAAGALFFAIHPLRVESVAWATERRDVLSGLFWLLALLAYVHAARDARGRGRWLALGALACSLGAKAWGMTFPLVLVILDAWPLRRLARAPVAVLREKIPFAVLAVAAAVMAWRAQASVPEMRSLAEHGVVARIAQASYGLVHYLVATVFPRDLHPAYLLEPDFDPTRPRYVLAFLAVTAFSTAAVLVRRRVPGLLATWLAYVVIVAPVLGLAQTGPQLVADRYTYLALLPWTALLAAGLRDLLAASHPRRLRAVAMTVAAIVLTTLGVLTYRQTRVWRDSMTLWNHVLRIDPGNWVAYTNRGFAHRDDPDAALADYSAAIALNPRYALAFFDRATVRHARGDYAGAIADASTVITLEPDDPRGWNNRGWARQTIGDWEGAAADYARALEVAAPDWWGRDLVLRNLATARARISANGR